MSRLRLLLGFAALLASAALAPIQSPARLSGIVVTNDANPQPVRRATVRLSEGGRTATTDDDGKFEFVALAPGRYTVTVEKPPYLTTQFGAVRPRGPGTPVAIAAGQVTSGIVVRLPRGAVITGTIRDVDGQPVPNLPVGVSPGSHSDQAVTDDRGMYRIFGLAPGDYVVRATPRGVAGASNVSSTADVNAALADLQRRYGRGRGVAPTSAPGVAARGGPASSAATVPEPAGRFGYAVVYFPGTVRADEARTVAVGEGEERVAVDFSLVLAGTTRISGVVVGPEGQPVAGASLSIASTAPMTIDSLRPSVSLWPDKDGAFVIVNVTPGHYTLTARVNAPGTTTVMDRPRLDLWGAAEVDAADTDSAGLIVRLGPAATFSGRVAFQRSSLSPPSDLTAVRIELASPAQSTDAPVLPPKAAALRPDGTFTIGPFTPGAVRIRSNLPDPEGGWWLRSATANGRDLLDYPLDFSTTGSITGAVLTFSDRHTQISGVLQHAAGVPAPEHTVVVFPADRQLWNATSRRMRTMRPATDGHFAFRDLPPGDYLVAALTDVDAEAWREAEFVERLVGAAVRIALGEGEKTILDLSVKRAE